MVNFDRYGKRKRWTQARASEAQYSTNLRSVARQIGAIVKGLAPGGSLEHVGQLIKALTDYADYATPWANSVAAFMLADVARRDEAMWRKNSKDLAASIRREIVLAPSGQILRSSQAEQVELIRSIPLDAAERVHKYSMEAITTGTRAKEIAAEIMRTEHVSKSKAMVIARTEVSRAASNLVEARAVLAGSEGYIWRTSGDSDVRESHQEMEGKYVRWKQPPTLDGLTGHAGCLPNCRCYAEPIFPDF